MEHLLQRIFFQKFDIFAISSVIFSLFICVCEMLLVINSMPQTFLLRGKTKSISSASVETFTFAY